MLRVLLRNCVAFLRQTVANRLSVASTRVERQWHRLVLRFLNQEAAVEVCLYWTILADLPKELVG